MVLSHNKTNLIARHLIRRSWRALYYKEAIFLHLIPITFLDLTTDFVYSISSMASSVILVRDYRDEVILFDPQHL